MQDSPPFSRGTSSPAGNPMGQQPSPVDPGNPPPQTPAAPESPAPQPQSELEQELSAPESGKPAIRTMKSDIERLFKTTPPSVAQMIAKPIAARAAAKKHGRIASAYIVLGILVLLLLFAGIGVYYFRNTIFPPPQVTEVKKAVPLQPFFATESSRTLEIKQNDRQKFFDLMNDSMKEYERDGTMKRILIKLSDTPEQRYVTLAEFFDFYHITPPENFLKRLTSDPMFFVYTSAGSTRLGLAIRTSDPTRTLRDLLDCEQTMLLDMKPLLFSQEPAPLSPVFEDRSYHNIDWRFLKLSSNIDIGIGYTIFPSGNILVIATSREEMETVINRLFDVH